MVEGGVRADERRPAGFWIRTVAVLIDFAIFAIVQFSFGFVAGSVWGAEIEELAPFQTAVVLATLLFTAAYSTVLHALTGQTVGKMVVGIRVVATDGELLTLGGAFLRYLGYYASLGPLAFGYLMAGLRKDKRALHDLLAGSRVERLAAPRPAPAPAVDRPLA